MTTNERKNKNIHSLSELEIIGNKTISIKENEGILVMRRGNCYTTYHSTIIDGSVYWTPIDAHTY